MIKWKKVRKKPVVVEAFQLTEELYNKFRKTTTLNVYFPKGLKRSLVSCNEKGLLISTLEGTMQANIGDWIIKGVNGEIYPCKPDIFEKTYDILGTEQFMYNGISYLQHIHAKMKDLDFCLTNTTKPDELFQEIMECFPFLENKLLNY